METARGQSRLSHTDYMRALLASWPSDPLCKVDLHRLCRVDSSEIGITRWQAMISYIDKYRGDYDGFVITHGTDTMAHTAAALALALSPVINFPVILTGSMRAPDRKDSDAPANLVQAIRLACSDLAEVAIAMRGRVWRGMRAEKTASTQGATFTTSETACLVDRRMRLRSHARRRTSSAPVGKAINLFNDRWCFYHALPILRPPDPVDVDTMVLVAAGGNLSPAYLDFARQNTRLGKTVIIGSTFATSGVYPPAAQAVEAGAILATRYALSALVVKVAWLLARSKETKQDSAQRQEFLRKELARSYAGEI